MEPDILILRQVWDFLTICWTALRGTAFLTWNAR